MPLDSELAQQIEGPVLALPVLSAEVEKLFKIRGGAKEPYEVRLDEFSCTCPDWTEQRVRFAFPDIRRACKHIIGALPSAQFERNGSQLVGLLLPIPPCNFRLGEFRVGAHALLIMQTEATSWLNIVAAKRGKADEPIYDFFGYEPERNRWSYGESPRNSKVIKNIVHGWLGIQPKRWTGDLPPLPPSALQAKQKHILEKQEELLRQEESKLNCYVCGLKLGFPPDATESFEIICPRCSITNILTQSGSTNRPERMAIYRKYDGDLYAQERSGLVAILKQQLRKEFEPVTLKKMEGRIDEKEYKRLLKAHGMKEGKLLGDLEDQKRMELNLLLKQEKDIRKRLGIK